MTSTHFVFLRAINTGGRRLTNDQQLAPFRRAGYADAEAYQAAGNIVVRSDGPVEPADLDPIVAAAYGFDAPTFVRTAGQLADVVDRQPFTAAHLAASSGKVQVAFMSRSPGTDEVAEVMALVPDHDTVVVAGTEWYWLPLAGVGDSSLPAKAIERIVGPMTVRTLGTLERMLKKFH